MGNTLSLAQRVFSCVPSHIAHNFSSSKIFEASPTNDTQYDHDNIQDSSTIFTLSGVSSFAPTTSSSRLAPLNAYVPDGLSPQEWKQIKLKEEQKYKNKDLGSLGPRGFKSRSMEAWQKAYERGETGHHFAPIGFREKLKQGLIKKEDVPYMLRKGGKWDNSDVFGAKRKRWLKEDKEYARGGYKKEQSASILGSGPGFDWTGTRPRSENLKRLIPGLS